jgi:hypothetical protein
VLDLQVAPTILAEPAAAIGSCNVFVALELGTLSVAGFDGRHGALVCWNSW